MNVDVRRLLTLLDITTEERVRGDLWAPCPFPQHDEEDPSWHIDAETGQNWCFGCTRGGSAVDLVTEVVGFSGFRPARDWMESQGVLGERSSSLAAVELISQTPKRATGAMEMPNGVTGLGELERWPDSIRRYATSRGLTSGQVDRWGLGAGIAGRLLGRLWMPVRASNGVLLNWTARAIDNRKPRYRNPSRSEKPDTAAVFGMATWPERLSEEEVVATEGELNALACERAGAAFIAGLGGSRLDLTQVARVARFGSIVLALDPDRAGEVLTEALGPMSRWRRVRVAQLPEGRDPCDVEADGGPEALREALSYVA